MSHGTRGAAAALLSAALAAVCGLSATARAATPVAANANDRPVYLQSARADAEPGVAAAAGAPDSRRPLMALLDDLGVAGPLDEARVRIFGHVEGSWTHNFDDPGSDINVGRLFDLEHDDPTLNQVSLNVERSVVPSGDAWDWGFRVEVLYGGDARFTHANGLLDHHEDDGGIVPGPDEQWDLLQAYADVNAPVGEGLRLRLGKFTYFKVIDPVASPLYSRSYSFGGALPFTLTGAMATYSLSDTSSVDLGVSRGWDQALEDNNGDSLNVFGGFRTAIGDSTNLAIKAITGPELEDNSGAYRTAVDVTLSQRISDQLTLIGNGIVGHQSGGPDGGLFSHAWWYGVAGYAIYDINEHLQLNGRLEWYRDEDGATVTGGPSANLYSATVGLTVTPFPNDNVLRGLKIRPEVRYDLASEDVFDLDDTGAGSDDSQFTGAIEAYFAF